MKCQMKVRKSQTLTARTAYEDLEKEVDSIMYDIFGSSDGDTDTDIIDVDSLIIPEISTHK